jgi:hypothetical protein
VRTEYLVVGRGTTRQLDDAVGKSELLDVLVGEEHTLGTKGVRGAEVIRPGNVIDGYKTN